ncbi:hypothetical protein PUNSTDRAFT_136037 [Punctularia strigosozonata HHB-11173 SS5]|uniref:uncharacterized protein n=1 Tax=Punctularia strigosozonata (strain HHB-11173) TaxID=741275 RepID=UPI000441754C|nr:uncharacterized protein PUNSTDRAFT_136037 [Punctularia strigosozonata HHB-11173 SS5]EIN07351.1 hypothetical protein PUNSTDRAFT_136037 [Punctularia strigosozonata HHB-11173 SS5]
MTGPSPPNLDVNGRRPDIDSTLLSPVFENSHRYASRNSRDVPLTRPSISDDALSDGEVSPVSPRLPSFSIPRPSHKPRAELQKLLAHSLEQLRRRPKPPSVFDQFKQGSANADDIGTGSVAETLRGAVKFKSARANGEGRATGQDESDDEDDGAVFSTNRTCELLSQMQEVLAVATEVFDSEYVHLINTVIEAEDDELALDE